MIKKMRYYNGSYSIMDNKKRDFENDCIYQSFKKSLFNILP